MIYQIFILRKPGDRVHIDVSPKMNLEKFGDIMHSCFGEPDGRRHAFFVDDKAYSQADCYYEVGSLQNRDISLKPIANKKGIANKPSENSAVNERSKLTG